MVRSAPSSPDPASFRTNKSSNKVHHENQHPGLKHLSQVKCLQKLPNMSPKLRNLLHLGHKDKKANTDEPKKGSVYAFENEGMSSDSLKTDKTKTNENGINALSPNLNIIRERSHSDGDDEPKQAEQDPNAGGTSLAELVLNLLKNKRQSEGYSSVGSEDKEDEFSDIKIDNMDEITNNNGTHKSGNASDNDRGQSQSLSLKDRIMSGSQSARKGSKGSGNKDSLSLLSPPLIVLTHDGDTSSSRYRLYCLAFFYSSRRYVHTHSTPPFYV